MVFIVIKILFVTNLVVYVHGLPRMTKWSSCGLNHIRSKQECGHLTMVNSTKAKIQHDFLEWNPNVFIVHDISAEINTI